MLHRELNSTEAVEFVEWANDNYQANQPIDRDLWHPVIVKRCDEINDLHYTRRNQEVIDRALSRIFTDVLNRDLKGIEEILKWIPKHRLLRYIDSETAADKLVRVSNPFPLGGRMKTYKFWNPDYVSNYISSDVLDPHTCTAAELTQAETSGNISTNILLVDDKQADAIVELFTNETNYEAFRYGQVQEDV